MKLTNKRGKEIPFIGLGTFPLQGRELADVVRKSVEVGYRLFDTADDYRGESGIGIAIKELVRSNVCKREDLFLQTKISDNNAHADEPLIGVYFNENSKFMKRHSAEETVREKVAISLREMGTDYLDSLLIHYPYPNYYIEIWKAMIKLKNEGVVRYIGVSNFHEKHIENLINESGVCPEINEVYASPIGIKKDLVDYCNKQGCLFMTYSPLKDLASNRIPVSQIRPIADKYKKTIAQIILRWNIERRCLPLPKSQSPKRLLENFDVWNFCLTEDEVETINELNYDYQFIVESKICPGI